MKPVADVVHEEAIKVGEATKAPDYCFRIGGACKIFLEAKRPSVDIKNDVSPAFAAACPTKESRRSFLKSKQQNLNPSRFQVAFESGWSGTPIRASVTSLLTLSASPTA